MSERWEDTNQPSHRRLGICICISVLQRGTFLRCRSDRYTFIFRQFLNADVHKRDGRIRTNPLTAALVFVPITRSSTELLSFVVETIDSSFLGTGSSWTQLILKKSDSMLMKALIAHLRFRHHNCKFPRYGQRTPGETSGRHSS